MISKLKKMERQYEYITKLEQALENRDLPDKFYSRFGNDAGNGTFFLSSSMNIVFTLPNCYDGMEEHWLEDREVREYLGIEED